MPLTVGARLGSYEIVAPIGSGGMGEVYRAHDTTLRRDVAIKILPAAFTADPGRLARFEREARVLAALNHPHIAAIYGVEQADGVKGLVLELVEGETLADRICRGPVPLAEALRVALQIAEALDAAHEKGIVHRDLKPANIKITARGAPPPRAKDLALERRLSRSAMPDGIVKVLDFGLAKIEDEPGAHTDSSNLSTITVGGTKEGAVLGTAAYMSPEQARGQTVDKRTDIWAFGCVLYELLGGRAAFARDTITDTLAAIVERSPDWQALPANTPSGIRHLLRRCLEKDPGRRLRDIGDARIELDDAAAMFVDSMLTERQPASAGDVGGATAVSNSGAAAHGGAPVVLSGWSRRRLAVGVVAIAILAAALDSGATWILRRSTAPPSQTTRFSLPLGEGQQFIVPSAHQIAISPDGSKIAYAANGRLYLRAVSDSEARPIPGTDVGVTVPVFSPDGRSLAFHANSDHTVKRIGVTGGTAVTLSAASVVTGMSWGADGIVFSLGGGIPGPGDPAILRVAASGGKLETLVRGAKGELALHPQVVADGQILLFTMVHGPGADGWVHWERDVQIIAQSIPTGERHVLLTGGADARYLPTGHLVYAMGATLYAVHLDLTRFALVGTPTPVIDGVRRGPVVRTTTHFSVSDNGTLVYLSGPAVAGEQLMVFVQVDRSGQIVPLSLSSGCPYPRYSPDGTRLVCDIYVFGQPRQIGVYDLSGAPEVRRLTLTGENRYPTWSPDGLRIAYQSNRDGDLGLFWQRADGIGSAERLTTAKDGTGHLPDTWSPDGQTLLFEIADEKSLRFPIDMGQFSLWVLSLRDRRIERFGTVESRTSIDAVFSPDGRWVAYDVDEGTGPRVYVEPFPRTGERYLVTNERGWNPFWSPEGKALFYSAGPDQFRLATFSTKPTIAFSNVVSVPRGRIFEPGGTSIDRREYDLSPDGKHIVGAISAPTKQQALAPTIEVVLNWFEELKAKVP